MMQNFEIFYDSDQTDFKNFISGIEDNITRTIIKDAKISTEARKKGDALYKKRIHGFVDHDQIFNLYCESIAFAPNGSKELALAYRSRSTFLFHIKRYEDCINDIDKVLSMIKIDLLKEKLNQEKSQCLLALESLKLENLKLSEKAIPKLGEAAVNTKENDSLIAKNAHKIKDCNEITDIFESVDIRYSIEHGRHLVAKRDFNPGEIIFVEKYFTLVVDPKKSLISCSNCSLMCWSGIPCEKCNWAMFCSKTCKDEAMEKFHDIECPIITYMMKSVFKEYFQVYHLAIRSVITGLKYAGGIKKLREEIESVEQCRDKIWRGFKDKETFNKNQFNSSYSLSDLQRKPDQLLTVDQALTELTLMYLVKVTTIFGIEQKFESIQDLKNNSDIIFFGSLFSKLLDIIQVNSHSVKNTERISCPYSRTEKSCMNNCCSRGLSLSPISSLINHSCYNNVTRCFTDDGKIIIYALQPIKKNSEIFDCYRRDFSEYSRRERNALLTFVCDCPACKYDWPPLLDSDSEMSRNYSMKKSESKIFKVCKNLFLATESGASVVNVDKAIETISEYTIRAFKDLPEPALSTCMLMKSMEYFLKKKYGYRPVEYGVCS